MTTGITRADVVVPEQYGSAPKSKPKKAPKAQVKLFKGAKRPRGKR